MKFCGKCGTQMDDMAAFCPSCGAPSETPAQPQAPMQPKAVGGDFVAQVNGRLQQFGKQKWYYVAILGTMFLQLLIASLFNCLQASVSMWGMEQSQSTTLWHEEYGVVGVLMAVVLLAGLVAAAAPLSGKLTFKPWNLFAAAGASGVMLLVTLWMYLSFSSDGAEATKEIEAFGGSCSYGFSFFGYLLIAASVATIVLVYLVNKAMTTKPQQPAQPQMPMY